MRTQKETAGVAAVVAAVTPALTLAVLAVAASAAVVPAAGPASVETLAGGSILGGDAGQPLLRAADARATAGEYGGGTLKRGRPNSRGHGFVRDARGFTEVDVPGASITAVFGSNSGGQIVGAYLDARKRSMDSSVRGGAFAGSTSPAPRERLPAGSTTGAASSVRTPRTPVLPCSGPSTASCSTSAAGSGGSTCPARP